MVNVLTNKIFGEVAFTFHCLQSLTFDNEWKGEDNYKVVSLIREKYLLGKPYFIYKDSDCDLLVELGPELDKFTLVEMSNLLNDFPKNIIELQQRSLFMLCKQYPKYGEEIEYFDYHHFFAADDSDFKFIIKAMLNKNWIDINITEGIGGVCVLSKPFLITEDGWHEIEKNLERNYSKQVFVAMWFDKKMDKAAQKIEEAIKACKLKIMRIDRKEHNNEISGEILHEIMNSRIMVADVTGHRNGVYFEAGFALGHKKSVIWTCQKEDFNNVHFDTRQYNHIIWENEDDLYTKLKSRILSTLAIEEE